MAESDLRLTVVVPARNAAAYMETTLSALRASDLPRDAWEMIVVDDASTDETASLAHRFADKVVSTGAAARGPAYARNRGAELASAPNIAFVDADVGVHADALRLMLETIDPDNGIVAAFGSYDDTPADERHVSQYRNLLHHYVHHRNAGETSTFWAGCGVVTAQAFRGVGMFDESFRRPQIEDIELGYRLRAAGGRIVIQPRIQGTHYKAWPVLPMLRTDLVDRAIPWVRLLMSSPPKGRTPTPSLGGREIAGTAAVAASLLLAAASFIWSSAALLTVALACAVFFLAINREFYSWLFHKRNGAVLARAIPLHFLYQVLNLIAVPAGVALHFRGRLRSFLAGSSDGNGTSFGRFLPLASGEVGARVIAFAATAYLARRLGASGFGQIAFAAAVVAQAGMALASGIGEIGSREVARHPEKARSLAATGVTARLLGAIVAMTVVVGLAFLLPLESEMRRVTALSSVFLIPLALDTGWVYRGQGAMRKAGLALLLSEAASLCLIVLFVRHASHVLRVPVLQALGDLVAAIFLAMPFLRGRWKLPDFAAVMELSRRSGMNTISRALRTIIVSFDVILLGVMVSSTQVGLYSAAYRIVFFIMAVISASHIAFLPEMTRAASEPSRLSAILSHALGLSLAVTIPFVVGGALIAPGLMSLVFGTAYTGGAAALQLLLAGVLFAAMHGAARNIFLVTHRIGLGTALMAAGAAVNVVLNFILIPRSGIAGAAIATGASELVMLILTAATLARLGIWPRANGMVAPFVGGAALAIAILAVGRTRPVPELLIVGGTVYLAALGGYHSIAERAGWVKREIIV